MIVAWGLYNRSALRAGEWKRLLQLGVGVGFGRRCPRFWRFPYHPCARHLLLLLLPFRSAVRRPVTPCAPVRSLRSALLICHIELEPPQSPKVRLFFFEYFPITRPEIGDSWGNRVFEDTPKEGSTPPSVFPLCIYSIGSPTLQCADPKYFLLCG